MKQKTRSPFLRLLSYLKPYRKDYILATTYSLLNKVFDIAPEILIGIAVDVVVKKQNSWLASVGIVNLTNQLLSLGILTLFIWGFESFFEYLYSLKWRNLAQTIQHSLRLEACEHVQNLDMETFEGQSTGNLLSILNDDVNQLERFLENGMNQIIQIFASSFLIGLIFFIIAPSIALLAVVPVPLILIGSFYFQNKLNPLFLVVREKAGAISKVLTNNITGIVTIKSHTSEKYALEQLKNASEEYREANRAAIRWSSLVTPVIRIAILIGFVATLIYGGFLAIQGDLSIGAYSILIFLTQRLLWPLTMLAEITVNYQRAMASTTRTLNLLNTPISISLDGKPFKDVDGEVSFNAVSFAYRNHPPLLNSISFKIRPKETVAFVGTTGSGKTTLMKLLLRFYQPSSGKISIDGKDISRLSLKDLRDSLGIVTQDVFLFDGTIAENIAYGNPETPIEKIVEASKLAESEEFIRHLPNGYHTLIGERGQKLSGGQRQRIAIARAILRNPSILILDEATSAVDNETEIAIQKSLKHIISDRTTILIAHRLSTVRLAHRIFVMKHGQIVEEGSHDTLIKQNGIYSELWRLQKGEEIINEELIKVTE